MNLAPQEGCSSQTERTIDRVGEIFRRHLEVFVGGLILTMWLPITILRALGWWEPTGGLSRAAGPGSIAVGGVLVLTASALLLRVFPSRAAPDRSIRRKLASACLALAAVIVFLLLVVAGFLDGVGTGSLLGSGALLSLALSSLWYRWRRRTCDPGYAGLEAAAVGAATATFVVTVTAFVVIVLQDRLPDPSATGLGPIEVLAMGLANAGALLGLPFMILGLLALSPWIFADSLAGEDEGR